MSAKITITASDVWCYFFDLKEDLKSHMHQIAENPEYGIAIFVTEDSGLPSIVVTADDVQVYDEKAVNEHDCKKTVEKIYDEYLTDKVLTTLTGYADEDDDPTEMEIEDMIAEREDELDCAVYDFLMTVMQGSYCDFYGDNGFDDMLDDLKEHFLEYMARKHELPIYRPMVLEYEDGTEELSEYPYEDIEFDDPDNPIYKA